MCIDQRSCFQLVAMLHCHISVKAQCGQSGCLRARFVFRVNTCIFEQTNKEEGGEASRFVCAGRCSSPANSAGGETPGSERMDQQVKEISEGNSTLIFISEVKNC